MSKRNQHKVDAKQSTPVSCAGIDDALSLLIKKTTDNAQVKLSFEEIPEYYKHANKVKNNRTRKDMISVAKSAMDVWHRRDEHLLRKRYLRLSFNLVGVVIYASLIIVVLSGAGVIVLAPTVQIAMLTTMVANVIGILLTAMIWLYKKDVAIQDERRVVEE